MTGSTHVPGLTTRLVALVVAGAACASGGDVGTGGVESAAAPAERAQAICDGSGAVEVDQVESSPRRDVPSALDDPFDERFPDPVIDPGEIRSGGPPPDGIPPIDDPRFQQQCAVDWLTLAEPVVSIEVGGDARAYPLRIMTWHEIVNDTVGGIPVSVSYCPLCNSAVGYDRRLGDSVLDFGTSGDLLRSSLVMYDRQTESLWAHFTAQAIVGALAGRELDVIPMQTIGFGDFRRAYPDGLVLTEDTGHSRDYGRNPYVGYDDEGSTPFLFDGDTDEALPAKARIVALEHEGEATALVLESLLDERVVEFEAGGDRLVAFAKEGTASALDADQIADGRDVGSTGVFVPAIDGRQLTFQPDGVGFRDDETGSTWDIVGRAVAGPLAGEQLEAIDHLDTFWFAWSSFHPDTAIALT